MNLKRILELCLLTVVVVSSGMLSVSIESSRLFTIAICCAVLSFIVTDVLKIFRLKGWLANVTSIAVLLFAMKDFFAVDSSGKLVAVANLLVYLQSILIFQEKTPRLNWQILILSLLQVVITTIFSLGFSSSYLMLVFFAVVGATMVFQCFYAETIDINRRNRKSLDRLGQLFPGQDRGQPRGNAESSGEQATITLHRPLMFYENPAYHQKTIVLSMVQLAYWLGAGLFFTVILFLMAPRSSKPLFEPITYEVAATGFNDQVDLNEDGVIPQSNRVMFRAQLLDLGNNKPIRLPSAPYFRGMALSLHSLKDGHTNWIAPYDRIDDSHYHFLPQMPKYSDCIKQVVTLQQTASPMVYGVSPVYATPNTPSAIQFCDELSVHTRCRISGKVALAPFKYELATQRPPRLGELNCWPYQSQGGNRSRSIPMAPGSAEFASLTDMPLNRYPSIVQTAQRLADKVTAAGGTKLDIIKEFTDYFSANNFRYTLDFRTVKRRRSLDVVEDFFRNHRSGHCELYASALTLMFRSQGIPARLVTGFLAKDYHEITDSYVVRAKHAHAWVEVYVPPEDCSESMHRTGRAGSGGAWITADPNPTQELASPENDNDPIELARTVWQDMVLGVNRKNRGDNATGGQFLFMLFNDFHLASEGFVQKLRANAQNSQFQFAFFFIALVGVVAFLLKKSRNRNVPRGQTNSKKVGVFRRWMASAVGLISPKLEQWVLKAGAATGFYGQMESILTSQNLQRNGNQTHREFAQHVSKQLQQHPESQTISSIVLEVTRLFYRVRFGKSGLTDSESQKVKQQLKRLKLVLKEN